MKIILALYVATVLSVVTADLSGYSYPKPAKIREQHPSPSNIDTREYLPPAPSAEFHQSPSDLKKDYQSPVPLQDLRTPPVGVNNGPQPLVQAQLPPISGNGHQSLVQASPSGVNKEYLPPVSGRETRPAPSRLSKERQPEAPNGHQGQLLPAPTSVNGHKTFTESHPAPGNGNNEHQTLSQLPPAPGNANNGHRSLAQLPPAPGNGYNGQQTLAQLRPAPGNANNGHQILNQPRPAPSNVSPDYLPPVKGQDLRHESSNINSEAEALDNEDRHLEPVHYEFAYEVSDLPSGPEFGHRESRQGDIATGRYHVVLPDGRMQIVEYEASNQGYKPVIRYEAAPAHITSELSADQTVPEAAVAGYRY